MGVIEIPDNRHMCPFIQGGCARYFQWYYNNILIWQSFDILRV